MKPHRHAELIKAWADGAEIEYFDQASRKWQPPLGTSPSWTEYLKYRIKPESKPDIVTYDCVKLNHYECFFSFDKDNLKLTWCGETGKLKSAEVI